MRLLVPLLGEDLTEESIDALFVQADKDGSGRIDFPEFYQMMVSLSPKVTGSCHRPLRVDPWQGDCESPTQ